jgi:hypothetical protein
MKKRNAKIARVLLWAQTENIIAPKENAKCRPMPIVIFSKRLVKKIRKTKNAPEGSVFFVEKIIPAKVCEAINKI